MTTGFDWRSRSDEELEAQFNPRAAVSDAQDFIDAYATQSAAARAQLEGRHDIRYGPLPKQTYDLFVPAEPAPGPLPVQIFIHGGFWRALDKSDHSFTALPVTAAGAAQVNVNYDLCPDVDIAQIVDECRQAVAHVFANADEFGLDRTRVQIAGHSAGAHLAAMMLAVDWAAEGLPAEPFTSAVLSSGVFEPAVVSRISVNEQVRLTDAVAAATDAFHHLPRTHCPILVAVGGGETELWIAMSEAYAERLRAAGQNVDYLLVPERHHFSILQAQFEPDHELWRRSLTLLLNEG